MNRHLRSAWRLGCALAALSFCAIAAGRVTASPIQATVGTTDLGGLGNTFAIVNGPGSTANITSVTINVGSAANPGHFDISGGGSQAFTALLGGGATGLGAVNVVDNGNSLTINFSDFNPGEAFVFQIDVDGQNPAGGSGLNAILNAIAREAQTHTENLGSTISVTFERPGYQTTTLNGSLNNDVNLPVLGSVAGVGTVQGDIQPIPEPTSIAVFGAASLAGMWYLRRRRQPVVLAS